MSDSRQIMLDRIRSRTLPPAEAPAIDLERMIQYESLPDQFRDAAEFVGATVHHCAGVSEVQTLLDGMESFRDARCIASTVSGIAGNFDADKITKPQDLANLDWMVINGRFAVAENGAIWVPADEVPDRAQIFITQHLAIVVPKDELVPHMHAAYDRLGTFSGYGVFVSGPSKTADIEQSLVLGAHGCRTLNIFLLG